MIRLLGFSALFLFGASQGFEIHPRIINGVKSNVSDFPFYVYLESEQSKCGGVLIDNKYIQFASSFYFSFSYTGPLPDPSFGDLLSIFFFHEAYFFFHSSFGT